MAMKSGSQICDILAPLGINYDDLCDLINARHWRVFKQHVLSLSVNLEK